MNNPLRTFLSEENINCHREYMKTLRLQHSIMEKSIPEIKGKSVYEIEKMHISNKDKKDILPIFREYLAHQMYFNSFCIQPKSLSTIKKYYSSVEAFLYEIHLLAMKSESGFVFVFIGDRGIPEITHKHGYDRIKNTPRLALDISEHAYFLDYRFDKESYVRNALSHLDLSLLDNQGKK